VYGGAAACSSAAIHIVAINPPPGVARKVSSANLRREGRGSQPSDEALFKGTCWKWVLYWVRGRGE
jgi:hypothetical protein